MSASLVGSEMCIRDRRCSSSSPGRSAPATSSAKAPPSSSTARASAVSYTHLTLPTICSV
eukprot:7774401-Alexandrium_andersonii.AAC.1